MNTTLNRETRVVPKNPSRMGAFLLLWLVLAGCKTPAPTPSSRQQAQADLVVNFRSWNAISFIKPDITGFANALAVWPKTFTRDGLEKLLQNLKMPRDFVVVILDRRYDPDPMTANGGMDAIQKFFQAQGFQRVAFEDGSAWTPSQGYPILRDTGTESQRPEASSPTAGLGRIAAGSPEEW